MQSKRGMIYYIVFYQGAKISCKYVIEAKDCGSFKSIIYVSASKTSYHIRIRRTKATQT